MRCPKCGYNSFDHLNSCKKCGKDLVEFKQSFGIKSVLFPGQMSSGAVVEEAELENATADAAVAVATGAAAAAVATTVANAGDDGSIVGSADGDDFGFDFMGDSAEDDDLSFDELFEEAPEDEDIEETIEAPKEEAASEAEAGEDFSFDLPDEDAELEDDFGIDPVDKASDAAGDDDFSFDDKEPDLAGETEESGSEEDPKRPFDLPESPQTVGTPEAGLNHLEDLADVPSVEEIDVKSAVEVVSSKFEDDPEVYILEAAEAAPISSSPDEQLELAVPEVEPVVAASAPPFIATVSAADADLSVAPTVAPEDIAAASAFSFPSAAPSLGNCIGAFVFDLILLVIVGVSFVVAAEAAISTQKVRLLPSLETLIDLSVPYFLVLFFLAFGYFTLFHFLVGQTPGKMLTRLRVETTAGEPLAFSQAFLRSVGGLLQLLPVGLGYLTILVNPDRRGWNDRLAGTRVVALRETS
ncbi:MAG: RDD family protein [Desulfuromusa sp.]